MNKYPSQVKIDSLRSLRVACEQAQKASSAVTVAHVALRTAGLTCCEAAMNEAQAASKAAWTTFKRRFKAMASKLDSDAYDNFHKYIWE